MKARPREFRPTMPKLWDRLTIALFALLTLGNMVGWIRGRGAAAFVAALLMMAAGSWLYYRRRILGSPRLYADAEGVRFRVGNREESARWNEIERFEPEWYRNELRFIRKDGGRPIIVSIDMTTAEGERFHNLIEDYWKPPKA